MVRKLLYCIGFFFSISYTTQGIDLSEIDFKYLYDPQGPFKVHHFISCKDDSLRLFIDIQFRQANKHKLLREISFLAQKEFDDKGHDKLKPFIIQTDTLSRSMSLEVHLKVKPDNNYLIIDIEAPDQHYYYDLNINESAFFPCPVITSFNKTSNKAIINNLVKTSETVQFNHEYGEGNDFFIYQYPGQFKPAVPPMTINSGAGSPTLKIDSLFKSDNLIAGPPEMLYFVQVDTSSDAGISLLAIPGYFPKFRSTEELIAPLIYICTRKEYDDLKKAGDKKAFEEFWLTRTTTQEKARKVIRSFYRRVEGANRLFTTYKSGWKTDQGMIYIVYGSPSQVTRDGDVETWSYFRGGEQLFYRFKRTANLFTRSHYILLRDKIHYKQWFKEVAKWRKGNI